MDSMLESTAAKKAKQAGLKSLSEISEITGVSRQTLTNWSKEKPKLLDIILAGCLAKLHEKSEKSDNPSI